MPNHHKSTEHKAPFVKPKDQRPSRFDITAQMLMHEAGLLQNVSPSHEALKVVKRDRFHNEVAVDFIQWAEPQQAEFLKAFDKEGDTTRHEVFTAIMRRKNGISFSDDVARLLLAMDFESKALEIAVGYIDFKGFARELVPELKDKYQEPLQRKLLADAFEIVRSDKDCGDDTKRVLHRVVRGLRGDFQYQFEEGPSSNPTIAP